MIGFIFPPQWIPNHPYLAPFLLSARAKAKGIECKVFDLNLLFYRKHIAQKELKLFRQPETFPAPELFDLLQKKVRNSFKPKSDFVKVDFYDAYFKHKAYISSELWKAVSNKKNVFYQFYLNLIEDIDFKGFKLLGISIVSYSQIIPGLCFAALIKRNFPHIKIILGGDIISRIASPLAIEGKIWECVDAIICGEGENALDSISESLRNGEKIDFQRIPDAITKSNFVPKKNIAFNMKNYHMPDYSGVNLDDYLMPFPMITLEMSRGCYWSKCFFCECTDIPYRTRGIKSIIEEVEFLYERLKIRHFSFANLALPPHKLLEFAGEVVKKKMSIYWKGMIRAESVFLKKDLGILYESGCRMLLVGIESANQDTSTRINKGIDLSLLEEILRHFSNNNIWLHGYFIIGFPNETNEQIMDTLSFIKKNRQSLNSFSISKFTLLRDSGIFKNPELFNISINTRPQENLKTAHFNYSDTGNYDANLVNNRIKSLLETHPYDYSKWGHLDINYLFHYITEYGINFFKK